MNAAHIAGRLQRRGLRVLALCIALIAVGSIVTVGSARAQQAPGALPPAPGAGEKSASGGYTGASASLSTNGGSALEPYLFLLILAGGGIIAVVFAFAADNNVRKTRPFVRAQRR